MHLCDMGDCTHIREMQCTLEIQCDRVREGRHGLMYFDIALNYHATIKVAEHEQIQIKNPEQDYDTL